MIDEVEIISTELINGELHIVKRVRSNEMFLCYPSRPVPDRVWKEIYRAVNNGSLYRCSPFIEIQLDETTEGKHYPSEYIEERIEFDDGR